MRRLVSNRLVRSCVAGYMVGGATIAGAGIAVDNITAEWSRKAMNMHDKWLSDAESISVTNPYRQYKMELILKEASVALTYATCPSWRKWMMGEPYHHDDWMHFNTNLSEAGGNRCFLGPKFVCRYWWYPNDSNPL